MSKWQQLNARERYLVIGCGIFLCMYILYIGIFLPLFNAVDFKQQELREKRATLQWMSQLPRSYSTQVTQEHQSTSQLLTLISQQISQSSFKSEPYQLQQVGANDLQLSFENVPYTAFITWLWNFTENAQMNIKQLHIERTKVKGVVKVQGTFTK